MAVRKIFMYKQMFSGAYEKIKTNIIQRTPVTLFACIIEDYKQHSRLFY